MNTHHSPIVGQSLLSDREVCLLEEQLFDILNRCNGRNLVGPQANVVMTDCHPWIPKISRQMCIHYECTDNTTHSLYFTSRQKASNLISSLEDIRVIIDQGLGLEET